MAGRGLGARRRLVAGVVRIRLSRRAAAVLVGVAVLMPTMLRPEAVLADPSIIPSGSGTLVIGPQAMEGNLQIHPGDPLKAGFDFTMPGSHPGAQVTVENGSVTISVTCSNGSTPPPIALNLPAQTIAVTSNSSAWYPSGNQSDPSVYQGSLAAPDLCAGGMMSAASGATFRATVSSTDTTDALHFRFHYRDNTSGSWSATVSALPVPFAETLPSVQLTPGLGLTLGVDRASAVPGDVLTYTAIVTNTGATLALAGDLTASNTGTATTTVASYWDELATSLDSSTWTPFGGMGASQPGYTPAVAPPISSGMSLTVTPVAASGVAYPTGQDLVLGTTIAPGSTALWHYTASIPLTPSQVGFLLNPAQVKRVRGSLHVEVNPPNPQVTQPAVMSLDFTQEFLGASPAPTGAISGAAVSIQPPQGAAPLQFSASTTPGLASIAPGASVSVSGTTTVQAVAAKGANETDSAYLQRLAAIEGSTLVASTTASGSGWSGPVSPPSPAPTASTTEHLPIVSVAKSGPQTAGAGTTASYPLSLANSGGAPATGLSISDSLPNGASGTVSGVPASLAPGAGATATASYAIPGSQPAGSLADTAAVTWQDANGNAYGPVSSSFTTTVTNTLSGATLTLAPQTAGPDVVGQSQQLTATLVDRSGSPIANQALTFSITGANPTTVPATTDANGKATFSYTGANAGTDQAQATASAPGVALQSNTSSVSWIKPIQTVSMTPVQGNFFHAPSSATSFVARPGDTPDFGQTFPTIDFNPPAGTVPHNISGVTNQTRPFTDVTTDVNGNFNGTIVAQGNGVQAGVGTMSSFDAEFTGTLVAAQAGDVTFNIQVGDGFILGVGNGATRVNGDLTNPPASNASVFQGYGLIAAYQAQSAAATRTATVHFPAPGTYPFELDYFDCCDGDLSLTMTAAAIVPQTSPLSVYVGYADGLRPGGAAFPFPWIGSPDTTFVGDTHDVFDSGAVRFDNSSDSPITLDQVTVDVGPTHLDLWPRNLTVSPHQTLILAQTNNQNFDTSDYPSIQCSGNDGIIPKVNVTVAGVLTSYPDSHQILNTGGFDLACRGNESTAWQRIAGVSAAINVPVPPAVNLNLSPFSVPGATVGLTQKLTATAMDGQGLPVAGLPLTVQVFGANAQQLSTTTDANGVATFSYVGSNQGADQVQVSGFVTGLRAISNLASVTWTNPVQPGPNPQPSSAPPPSVSNPTPVDGTVVTKPVPVDATITPPAGQTIASWQVTYQAQDPGPVVTLASGTGAPPSPLATFDPTQLPNDSYQIGITAVASNGVTETLTTTVTVFGNLKLGRYVTTYQDLSVPVNGFQMEVRRRYDSIDKSQGDFGIGWRVDVVNFRTAPNRQLGAGGWSMYDTSCVFGLCTTGFKSSAPHYVSVTFPDQHTEIFDFTPQGGTNVFWTATAAFTARQGTGTTSKLEPVGGTALSYRGDGNLYDGSGLVYDPQRFKLTTLDGRVLVLDRTTGLVSETDRNGNSLTVDSSGVHASNGQSVVFTRDAAGRISRVAGPSGQTLSYGYSAAGDLTSSTDPNGNQTTYSYDASHDLLQASGAQPLQTFGYDASGRLVTITDALGNTARIASNVAGQQQTVTDPLGRLTTVYTFDDLGDVVREDEAFDGQVVTGTATYDAAGRMLSRTDGLGHASSQAYDASGNVVSATTAAGGTSSYTYDGFGRPLTGTDALGNVGKLQYDGNGNLLSVTNPLGQVLSFAYDAQGRVTSRTDALGARQYAYDASGNPASITDPLGNVTRAGHDASGRVTTITNAVGGAASYAYDAAGNMTVSTGADSRSTTYTYDSMNRLVSRTDAVGNTTTYQYDAVGRLASETDAAGRTTSYAYDADGNLVSTKDPAGGVTSQRYDGLGRLISVTDPMSRTTSYTYDAGDNLVTETQPNGGTWQHAYDASGKEVSVTDPLGHTTTNTYDAAGRLVATTDALGRTTRFTLDALGRAVGETNPLGQSTAIAYDGIGNVTADTDVAGNVTIYGYDAAGHVTSVTDPLGHGTTYGYDPVGRLVTATDPLGRTTQTRYDAVGRVVATLLPSGITTTTAYDAIGRPVSVADGLGHTTTSAYDAAGNVTSTTDPDGHTTTYGYDAAGRVNAINDALGGKASIAYDLDGEVTSIQDPRGAATTFAYDSMGSVSSQTTPASGTSSYAYDLAGHQVASTDARGITVSQAYDAAGNATTTSFPGGSIQVAYDALDRPVSMTDPTGTTTYGYDAASRLASVASPLGAVGYTYDNAGRRTAMSLPGGSRVVYSYDAGDQLTSMTDPTGRSFGFTYDADGRPKSVTRPNGVATSYGYDGAGRLVQVNQDSGSGPIAHYGYTLDPAGNRTAMTGAAGTETYTLDALNRLVGVSYPNGDLATYAYDAAGNRTSSTLNGVTTPYSYNSAGQLVAAGAASYTYDAAGNMTSAGPNTFTWDWAGRLVGANVGGVASSYTYDGSGLRVGAQTGGASSTYLWDRASALPALLSDGQTSYTSAGGGASGLLEQASAASVAYPLADALGSVRTLTDGSGGVTGTRAFDAFGAPRSSSGAQSIFGFAGAQTDPTGNLFLGARYMDPTTGRFLSTDPLLPGGPGTQGYNPYAYVENNPTTATDPTGKSPATDAAVRYEADATAAPALTALGVTWQVYYLMLIDAFLWSFDDTADCFWDLPPCSWVENALHRRATTATAPAPAPLPAPSPAPAGTPGSTTGVGTGYDYGQARQELETQLDQCKANKKFLFTLGGPGPSNLPPTNDRCRLGVNVYIPARDEERTTYGILDALAPGGVTDPGDTINPPPHPDLNPASHWLPWLYLHHDPSPMGVSPSNRGWYTAYTKLGDPCLGMGPGRVCDEYPFFSTYEGGNKWPSPFPPRAHLKLVPRNEQDSVQSSTLKNFYSRCNIPANHNSQDSGFFVIPLVSWDVTSYLCANWGTDPAVANPPVGNGPLP